MIHKSERATCTVVYSKHQFNPEGLLDFIEMEGFTDDWEDLRLDVDDLIGLQVSIMVNPRAAPVIEGTGGLRKLRFRPLKSAKGKSGAIRVCYAYFEEYAIVLLVVAYSKNDVATISPKHKKMYRQLIERQRAEFSKRPIK